MFEVMKVGQLMCTEFSEILSGDIQIYIPVNPAFWIKIDQGMMLIHVRSARLIQNLLQG